MDLVEHYLEKIQKIHGIWVLHVPGDISLSEIEGIRNNWTKTFPKEQLIVMPESVQIHKLNKYSFYIALMLIRGQKRITRLQWLKESEYSKESVPYLYLEEIDGKDMLIKKFPNEPEEDEFFMIDKETLDADDYILLE